MLEVIKILGSIVGLLTGGFIVYDRFLRFRPVIWLRPMTFRRIELHVRNLADEDLLVEEIGVRPPSVTVAVGSEVGDTVRAAAGQPFSIIIPAKADMGFPIVTRPEFDTLPDETRLSFKLRWSLASSRWIWQKPVVLRVSRGQFRRLNDATPARVAADKPPRAAE
jgi:hypothetical protein